MTWELFLGIAGSILAAFVGAAGAAFWSFRSWRKQRWIERRENIAEQILADFYEARDIIRSARHPGSFSGEGQTREPLKGETESEARYRNALYVPAERLLSFNELFARLEASKYRFMAIFGEDQAEPFNEIKKIRNRVIISSGMLIRTHRDHGEEREQQRRSREKWEQDIGWGDDENDPLAEKLETAVSKIESICRPLIAGR